MLKTLYISAAAASILTLVWVLVAGGPLRFTEQELGAEPTATPTSLPPLVEMLVKARSIASNADKDIALRIVAETALAGGDYGMAIKAAAYSPTYQARSDTLSTVAHRAIEEGLFEFADAAAGEIPLDSIRDYVKLRILEARRRAPP